MVQHVTYYVAVVYHTHTNYGCLTIDLMMWVPCRAYQHFTISLYTSRGHPGGGGWTYPFSLTITLTACIVCVCVCAYGVGVDVVCVCVCACVCVHACV